MTTKTTKDKTAPKGGETEQERKSVEIYALCHPLTGEIRYIGKANNTTKRLASHIRDSRRRDTPVYRWIRKLIKEGLAPVAKVLELCDGSWQEVEIRLISKYKETGRLLNVALGGDQPFCPLEVRQENARRVTIARVSTPLKAELYHLKRLLAIDLKEGYVLEATKEKMRALARKHPTLCGEWVSV